LTPTLEMISIEHEKPIDQSTARHYKHGKDDRGKRLARQHLPRPREIPPVWMRKTATAKTRTSRTLGGCMASVRVLFYCGRRKRHFSPRPHCNHIFVFWTRELETIEAVP
jgi:hypothetical protein